MGSTHGKNLNDNILLICPYCIQKIPNFELFIQNSIINIKLSCQCLEKKKIKKILSLKDFLQNLKQIKKQIKKCTYKTHNNNAINYCLNCEKWLCEHCNIKHNNNNYIECIKNQTNENCLIQNCHIHRTRKNLLNYYCKNCKIFLCLQCSYEHDVKNKKEHNIIRWIDYLDELKIEKKKNIFQKEINKEEIKYNNNKTQNIESLIKINKENNKNIFELIEILFKNIDDIENIKNKKIIINIINNTKFKIKNLEENESLIKYYNTNYININQKFQLNYINSIKNIKETINSIISLTENNFCLISSDSTIKIYNNENSILTLSGHTNKVISVIMLNNKKRLVSISNDSTIRIWDISNGENIKTINTYNLPMIILEIKGKENLIAELNLGNKIDIYDINSGEKIFNKTIQEFNWFESFYQLNNQDFLLGIFESIFIYNENFELKKEKKIFGHTLINYLEINNDILIGSREGTIFIFDNFYNFKSKLLGHQDSISNIIDYNEKYIITSSYDTSIKLWDKNNYELIDSFEGNSYPITSMIKIINNNIMTLNSNNNIDVWKIEEISE